MNLFIFFPHNLTAEQRASIDLEQLSGAVREAAPSDNMFRNVVVNWLQDRDIDTNELRDVLMTHIRSTDMISLDTQKDMMRSMEASVTAQLSKSNDNVSKNNDTGYRVFIGTTPLTVPIADKKRADFAFCMVCMMEGKGVNWLKNGKDIGAGTLHLIDKNGKAVEPELDKEWYDNDFYENNPVREAVLDQIVADIQAELDKEGVIDIKPDRAFQSKLMDEYTVCSFDEDRCRVRFAPHTWNIDKAGEMQNLMTYGMNPSIDVYFEGRIVSGKICVINSNGDVYRDRLNKKWAKEIVDDGQSFADAVASISVDDKRLEQ